MCFKNQALMDSDSSYLMTKTSIRNMLTLSYQLLVLYTWWLKMINLWKRQNWSNSMRNYLLSWGSHFLWEWKSYSKICAPIRIMNPHQAAIRALEMITNNTRPQFKSRYFTNLVGFLYSGHAKRRFLSMFQLPYLVIRSKEY